MKQFAFPVVLLFLTGLFSTVALSDVAMGQEDNWIVLFDGKTLNNWAKVKNYGSGDIVVENGAIQLKTGSMSTGIRYDNAKKPFPTANYELEYVAERVDGSDFFAAATFPVGKNCCTFVNGGWGGTLVGLSSIDGMDASENSSSTYFEFKNKVRYRFRIQVTKDSISAWIDDEQVVLTYIKDCNISIRFEMETCKPLGFANWVCHGALHSISYRLLTESEIADIDKAACKNDFSFNPNK